MRSFAYSVESSKSMSAKEVKFGTDARAKMLRSVDIMGCPLAADIPDFLSKLLADPLFYRGRGQATGERA
jgi:hypothetical protein